jgi:hypothetical protein
MTHLAKIRATVIVVKDGRDRPATLIAWRPARNQKRPDGSINRTRRNTARVDFGTGPLTVKCDKIREVG